MTANGSAALQGALWGARARDWAEIQEGATGPLYHAVLDALRIGSQASVLDAGCGSGVFCQLAAGRGAAVSGLDAAAGLIALARERVPQGDFRVGELEELPYADASFDVVSGFNSLQYAADPLGALREAARVTRPGGAVVVATWGEKRDCEASAYLVALASFFPSPPAGAPGPFALSQDGALEALARQADLEPVRAQEVECVWSYPDLDTALRGLLAAGPAVKAIQAAGESRVRRKVRQAIRPFRNAAGGYRLENRFRYLVAKA